MAVVVTDVMQSVPTNDGIDLHPALASLNAIERVSSGGSVAVGQATS